MSARRNAAAWLALAGALYLPVGGCGDLGFANPAIVANARILAIVAEEPERDLLEEFRVHALVREPTVRGPGDPPLELRWSACLGFDGLFSGSQAQFEGTTPTDGCPIGAGTTGDPCEPVVLVSEGESARFSLNPAALANPACAADIGGLLGDSSAGGGTLGGEGAQEFLTLLIDQAGIPLKVHLRVYEAGAPADATPLVEGYKRVAITTREELTTNPPRPLLRVGPQCVGAWEREGDARFRCGPIDETGQPAEAARLRMLAGSRVHLRPEPVPEFRSEGSWLDGYPILGIEGDLVCGRERAFYAWYATDGSFSSGGTESPFPDNAWVAPAVEEVTTFRLWVVLRDGHLGMSACEMEIEVVPVDDPSVGPDPLLVSGPSALPEAEPPCAPASAPPRPPPALPPICQGAP